MAYASVTHVVAHHPARPTYTATSVPNASFVAMMIDEAAAALGLCSCKRRMGLTAPFLCAIVG
jgi:hypothetical protein